MRLGRKAFAVAATVSVMAGGSGAAYAASCPGMSSAGSTTSTGTTTSTTGTTGTISTTGTTGTTSPSRSPPPAYVIAHSRPKRPPIRRLPGCVLIPDCLLLPCEFRSGHLARPERCTGERDPFGGGSSAYTVHTAAPHLEAGLTVRTVRTASQSSCMATMPATRHRWERPYET